VTRATSSVARHALAYATGSVVGGVSRAVLLPVIARRLTTEEYGVYALLLAAINLIHVLFEMGLVIGLIRFHHRTEDPEERQRLRATVFLFLPALDVLLAAPFLLARGLASRVLFGTPEHGGLFALAVGIAFFAAQFQLFLGHLRADDRSRTFAGLMAAKGAVSLGLTLWLVVGRGLGIGGLLAGSLAGPAVVSLVAIPRLLRRVGFRLAGSRERLGRLLRFGLPLVPSALGLWLLGHLDVYLLRVLDDLDAVGIYSFGSEICLPIALLMTSFQLAWPSFAFARARRPEGPEEIARVFRHLFVALIGGALTVAILRREIVAVIGTEAWRGSIPVIPWLALATCLYAASQVFGTGFQIAGDTRRLPFFVGLAALVNAGLNGLLIPAWREIGAAVATVVTNALLCGLVRRESDRQFPIPFEVRKLLGIVGAAAGILVVGDLLGDLPVGAGIALRLGLVLAYPLLLVPAGALTRRELVALPGVVREIAGGRVA
jgi:O-antigen/teichoic acid export membrane protein